MESNKNNSNGGDEHQQPRNGLTYDEDKSANESTSHEHQIGLPTQQQMKIQLSLETWYDMLAFLPRHQLGQIVPDIGDRQFASIVQKFLHEYREITIKHITIEAHPIGPRVIVWQDNDRLNFKMAETQMPANIKNFYLVDLSYFDEAVLNFMQKFQQNGLLDNVNLFLFISSKDILQQVLCRLLPLINGIATVETENSAQLVGIYETENSKEIYELNMKMMQKTRHLAVSFYEFEYDPEILRTNRIDLYCRWLYQTAREDGKPRVLILYYQMDVDYSRISLFIDRIKQNFLMATDPVTFFVRIDLPQHFQLAEGTCLDNDKTEERLLTKTEVVNVAVWEDKLNVLLISRYPRTSTKKWIVANEKEVFNWDTRNSEDRNIRLSNFRFAII